MNELVNVKIETHNGKPMVSSRVVAEQLEKQHSHVMTKIREVLGVAEFCETSYNDTQGKSNPELLLTKDGFILLCMNYQGYNDFKRAYIKKFNEMEHALNKPLDVSAEIDKIIADPEFGIKLLSTVKDERDKRKVLQMQNSQLSVSNAIMAPKADYFDQVVDRNLLTNFRDTAKALQVSEKVFIAFLLEKKYIFRDKKGKLTPYADKGAGLFETKECLNEKTQWAGTQTLITPKGRETFRLLCKGLPEKVMKKQIVKGQK